MKNKLTISCSRSNLCRVRKHLENFLFDSNVDDIKSHSIILAVDEICANIIIHSHHCNPTHTIEMSTEINHEKELVIVIRDRGNAFDLSNYKEPNINDLVSSNKKGGLGLMLVKRIMDEIEFYNENNHNICRLKKLL